MTSARVIRSSALWAAWADAMGFATELANESLVKRRTGETRLTALVPWSRRVGGRGGPTLRLPRGTYSDDTQLRLATARAIRGDGAFDVEAFSKVELPVWLAYSLGAGRGTSAAARSLSQATTHWTSNFFSSVNASYFAAGGNGAAMRIQPHVWASREPHAWDSFMPDVIRNAICTHGHPRGIVGAALHADVLSHALTGAGTPGPDEWSHTVERLAMLPNMVKHDETLATLWQPGWERATSIDLSSAMADSVDECDRLFSEVREVIARFGTEPATCYRELATRLDARNPKTRGSGTLTAVLAAALAWLARTNPTETLTAAVNELGTDTDTIATMAGAIVGAAVAEEPPLGVADADMISREADRLSEISQRKITDNFPYPDLLDWRPPRNQVDAVGYGDREALALSGLGYLSPRGDILANDHRLTAFWQWYDLPFGQRVLLKRRERPGIIPEGSRPAGGDRSVETALHGPRGSQLAFLDRGGSGATDVNEPATHAEPRSAPQPPTGRSPRVSARRDDIAKPKNTEAYIDAILRSRFDPPTDRARVHRSLTEGWRVRGGSRSGSGDRQSDTGTTRSRQTAITALS